MVERFHQSGREVGFTQGSEKVNSLLGLFDQIMRDCSVCMEDYTINFDQPYSHMRKYKMELPDAVLAFKLLDTACLDMKDQQLALCIHEICTDQDFQREKRQPPAWELIKTLHTSRSRDVRWASHGPRKINRRHHCLAQIHWTGMLADQNVLCVNPHFTGLKTV